MTVAQIQALKDPVDGFAKGGKRDKRRSCVKGDLDPDFHFFFFFDNQWLGVISAEELRAVAAVGAAQWDTIRTVITFLRFYSK